MGCTEMGRHSAPAYYQHGKCCGVYDLGAFGSRARQKDRTGAEKRRHCGGTGGARSVSGTAARAGQAPCRRNLSAVREGTAGAGIYGRMAGADGMRLRSADHAPAAFFCLHAGMGSQLYGRGRHTATRAVPPCKAESCGHGARHRKSSTGRNRARLYLREKSRWQKTRFAGLRVVFRNSSLKTRIRLLFR